MEHPAGRHRGRHDARAAGDVLLRRRVGLDTGCAARRDRGAVRAAAVRARSAAGRCRRRRRRRHRLRRPHQGPATRRDRPRDRRRARGRVRRTFIAWRRAWWSAPTVCGRPSPGWSARRRIAWDNMRAAPCMDTGVVSRSAGTGGTSAPVSARPPFRPTPVRYACRCRCRARNSPVGLHTNRTAPSANCCRRWRPVSPKRLRASSERRSRSPLHGFPGHAGFFRHAHGPGWALVGDAGYFKDPITAHGITDALRDAALLASAIDAGSDDALADYQEQRDAASLDLFETTDAIASFNWNLSTVRPLHEALAKSMSREVKRLVGA